MEIKGKVHCFFEQSGTFKNEFIKSGIPAEDYDYARNFICDFILGKVQKMKQASIFYKSIYKTPSPVL